MAKAAKMPGLNKALRAVNAVGKQMGAESSADYAVALSASAAGQKNLSKQTRGLTRNLLSGQLTQTTSLSKLAAAARAQRNVVASQQASAVSRYGSALGQSAASSFSVARATAKGTAKVAAGALQASKATSKVATTVAGIAQAGVAAQASAAKYSMNQALQQRNIIDNQTLAGLTGQLYNTALQYNMQQAMYEQQRADAAKDARKAAFSATESATAWLSTKGGEMGSWLLSADETNQYADENGKLNVGDALAAYVAEYQLDPNVNPNDASTIAIMSSALGKIKDGMDSSSAMTAAANELYGGYPGWEKISPNLLGAIGSDIAAKTEAKALENLQSIEGVTVSGNIGMGSMLGFNRYEPTSTEFRDAGAAAIREQYGSSTAKAWLRGQTNWNDSAIDVYLSMLPADLAGDLNYGTGGPVSGTTSGPPAATGSARVGISG